MAYAVNCSRDDVGRQPTIALKYYPDVCTILPAPVRKTRYPDGWMFSGRNQIRPVVTVPIASFTADQWERELRMPSVSVNMQPIRKERQKLVPSRRHSSIRWISGGYSVIRIFGSGLLSTRPRRPPSPFSRCWPAHIILMECRRIYESNSTQFIGGISRGKSKKNGCTFKGSKPKKIFLLREAMGAQWDICKNGLTGWEDNISWSPCA